jgi:hypothetical protein
MAKRKPRKTDRKLPHYTRWATWERDVLSRVADPAGVQRLIAQRQAEVDDDATEMELVRGYFRNKIADCDKHPDKACIFLPNPVAQVLLEGATGEYLPTNKALTKLEMLGIPELSMTTKKDEQHHVRRGWRWMGADAPKGAKMIDYPYMVVIKERR